MLPLNKMCVFRGNSSVDGIFLGHQLRGDSSCHGGAGEGDPAGFPRPGRHLLALSSHQGVALQCTLGTFENDSRAWGWGRPSLTRAKAGVGGAWESAQRCGLPACPAPPSCCLRLFPPREESTGRSPGRESLSGWGRTLSGSLVPVPGCGPVRVVRCKRGGGAVSLHRRGAGRRRARRRRWSRSEQAAGGPARLDGERAARPLGVAPSAWASSLPVLLVSRGAPSSRLCGLAGAGVGACDGRGAGTVTCDRFLAPGPARLWGWPQRALRRPVWDETLQKRRPGCWPGARGREDAVDGTCHAPRVVTDSLGVALSASKGPGVRRRCEQCPLPAGRAAGADRCSPGHRPPVPTALLRAGLPLPVAAAARGARGSGDEPRQPPVTPSRHLLPSLGGGRGAGGLRQACRVVAVHLLFRPSPPSERRT